MQKFIQDERECWQIFHKKVNYCLKYLSGFLVSEVFLVARRINGPSVIYSVTHSLAQPYRGVTINKITILSMDVTDFYAHVSREPLSIQDLENIVNSLGTISKIYSSVYFFNFTDTPIFLLLFLSLSLLIFFSFYL